ncbi:MAG: hypothetical protein AAGA66_10775 [Bacteroidota bacterium]
MKESKWANTIYFAYNSLVIGAKGILLSQDIRCNTHKGIIEDFQKQIVEQGLISLDQPYEELVLQINQNEPTEQFARAYVNEAREFLRKVVAFRKSEQLSLEEDKLVVSSHYKA